MKERKKLNGDSIVPNHLSSSVHLSFPPSLGSRFLDASSHLYKRVCPSVRPYVRMSFTIREQGRIHGRGCGKNGRKPPKTAIWAHIVAHIVPTLLPLQESSLYEGLSVRQSVCQKIRRKWRSELGLVFFLVRPAFCFFFFLNFAILIASLVFHFLALALSHRFAFVTSMGTPWQMRPTLPYLFSHFWPRFWPLFSSYWKRVKIALFLNLLLPLPSLSTITKTLSSQHDHKYDHDCDHDLLMIIRWKSRFYDRQFENGKVEINVLIKNREQSH